MKLLALLLALHLLICAVFLREDWIAACARQEVAGHTRVLGADVVATATARGARWYALGLLDSGIVDAANALYVVPPDGRADGADFGSAVPWFHAWFEQRLRALFGIAWQACLRASIALAWLPYGAAVLLPCVVDGLVRRQIKRSNFDYASPAVYGYGIALIGWLLFVLAGLLIAPWPLSPWAIPTLLLALALVAGAVAANVPKEF